MTEPLISFVHRHHNWGKVRTILNALRKMFSNEQFILITANMKADIKNGLETGDLQLNAKVTYYGLTEKGCVRLMRDACTEESEALDFVDKAKFFITSTEN